MGIWTCKRRKSCKFASLAKIRSDVDIYWMQSFVFPFFYVGFTKVTRWPTNMIAKIALSLIGGAALTGLGVLVIILSAFFGG